MTYKELLDSVSFEEIAPFIAKYHGDNDCMVLYKIHYDMLRGLIPDPEQAYYKTATVSHGEQEEDWPDPHLMVHPIEGQIWEGALTVELIIDSDVKESLAEIAACCLWHTSFYGFTEDQLEETFKRWENGHNDLSEEEAKRLEIKKYIQRIEEAGGHVPSMQELPDISDEADYRKRIDVIGGFITVALPQESDVVCMSVGELCKLFHAKHCKWYMLKSYCLDAARRTTYLKELIEKYNAFDYGTLEHVIVVITTSADYPLLMEEMELVSYIGTMCSGTVSYIVKVDPDIEKEMKIDVAFYEYEKEQKEQNG